MTALSYLTQIHRDKVGLSIWSSDADNYTTVTSTYWLEPHEAAAIAKMLQQEVARMPTACIAADLGLEAA